MGELMVSAWFREHPGASELVGLTLNCCQLTGETLLAWKRSWRQVPKAIASGEQAWRNGTYPCNGTADWLGVTCDGARVVGL